MPRGVNDLDRVTLAGPMTSRDDDVDTDRRFINCYPEKTDENEIYVTKRPGLKASINVSGEGVTSQVPRGCYYWDGNLYHAWGQKLFRGGSEIGTDALALTTGRISFTVSNDNSKLLIHEPGASNSLRNGMWVISLGWKARRGSLPQSSTVVLKIFTRGAQPLITSALFK